MVGNVVNISDRDVFIDIGFKTEGIVPLSEFKNPPIIGKELEVVVDVNTVVCCVVVVVVVICSMTVSVYCVVVVVSSKPPLRATSVFVTIDVTVLDVTVPPFGPVSPT